MDRPRRPYSVQKRPTSNPHRHVYYVKFRDLDTGLYRSAVSLGRTNKAAAMNWADERIKAGLVTVTRK